MAADAHVPPARAALECVGLSKAYDGHAAVTDLYLEVAAGRVHALVGANGAGKSTVLGMMSGRTAPTTGIVRVFGQELRGGKPREARRAGISSVYQELTLVPHLSACANVFLGAEQSARGMLTERQMRRRYDELRETFGLAVPADTPAGELSVGVGQQLEIMRAVQRGSRIILLDEPTAALSYRERDHLLGLMRRLRDDGVTLVFVSHNLDEVLAISDTVTVMRNARHVVTSRAADWTKPELVAAMTGSELGAELASPSLDERDRRAAEVVRVEQLQLRPAAPPVSFAVREGEVLGLAGLVGSGRTTALRSIAGAHRSAGGRMTRRGLPVAWPRTPRQALRLGIAMLPEDRKSQGLVLGMSIPDNITAPDLQKVSKGGLVMKAAQRQVSARLMERFGLNRKVGDYPVINLSGGGQQKVAFARAMFSGPEVLLIDEPTRGVDVSSKVDLLRALREFADGGGAVVMTSAEIEEVLDVSDRILVFKDGAAVAEYDMRATRPTVRQILDHAFGVTSK